MKGSGTRPGIHGLARERRVQLGDALPHQLGRLEVRADQLVRLGREPGRCARSSRPRRGGSGAGRPFWIRSVTTHS